MSLHQLQARSLARRVARHAGVDVLLFSERIAHIVPAPRSMSVGSLSDSLALYG